MTRAWYALVVFVLVACEDDKILPTPDAGVLCLSQVDILRFEGTHSYDPLCPPTGWTETAFLRTGDEPNRLGEHVAVRDRVIWASSRSGSTWRITRFDPSPLGWMSGASWSGDDLGSSAAYVRSLVVGPGFFVVGVATADRGVLVDEEVWHVRDAGGATRMTPTEVEDGDHFGEALALDGEVLLVGAPGDDGCDGPADPLECTDSGVVYRFRVSERGVTQDGFLKPTPERDSAVGASLALSAELAAVGAPSACSVSSCEGTGRVWIYDRAGDTWTARDPVGAVSATDQKFGSALAFAGRDLVIGVVLSYRCAADGEARCPRRVVAPGQPRSLCGDGEKKCQGGTTYLLNDGETMPVELRPDPYVGSAGWGRTVFGRANEFLIGATGDSSCAREWNGIELDLACDDAGAVHRFVRRDGAWVRADYMKAWDRHERAKYGTAVAAEEDLIVVGAPGSDRCQDRRAMTCHLTGGLYVYENLKEPAVE